MIGAVVVCRVCVMLFCAPDLKQSDRPVNFCEQKKLGKSRQIRVFIITLHMCVCVCGTVTYK